MIDFTQALPYLNGMSAQQFLKEYWHKKPLLVRNAFPQAAQNIAADDGLFSITPEDLAGLALDEDINARIVTGAHPANQWQVEHGPFDEARFAKLPQSEWSLLVSDVEKHLPDFAQLVDYFRFIPDWRFDDLMISYAPTGGSVGRHKDEYDVFLIQGRGVRRWQIESKPSQSALVPNLDLKILADFNPDQEWDLKAGDMLYLPPSLAHYGLSQSDDCMTFSVGFRAPKWQDLARDYCDELCEQIAASRYSDADLTLQPNPAQVCPHTIAAIKNHIGTLLKSDDAQFAKWLGVVLTQHHQEPALPLETLDPAALGNAIQSGRALLLSPSTRLCYMDDPAALRVFINSECYEMLGEFDRAAVCQILQNRQLHQGDLPADAPTQSALLGFLSAAYNHGMWLFEDELFEE